MLPLVYTIEGWVAARLIRLVRIPDSTNKDHGSHELLTSGGGMAAFATATNANGLGNMALTVIHKLLIGGFCAKAGCGPGKARPSAISDSTVRFTVASLAKFPSHFPSHFNEHKGRRGSYPGQPQAEGRCGSVTFSTR